MAGTTACPVTSLPVGVAYFCVACIWWTRVHCPLNLVCEPALTCSCSAWYLLSPGPYLSEHGARPLRCRLRGALTSSPDLQGVGRCPWSWKAAACPTKAAMFNSLVFNCSAVVL